MKTRLCGSACGLFLWVLLGCSSTYGQRQMENLGRGVVAVRTNSATVYVGWRLLGIDPDTIGFNLYRSANGGAPVQLTTNQTQTTDFVDTTANLTATNAYFVRPVIGGAEQTASASYILPERSGPTVHFHPAADPARRDHPERFLYV